MKARQIYQKFQTPENLQEHMLRVAALAEIITDGWKKNNLDSRAIITACLFHDIAKPMNFNLAKQADFGMSEIEIKKLADLQTFLKTNYSDNEHEAVVKICREINCSSLTVKLVDNLEWEYLPKLLASSDWQSLIPIYCDMRIAPQGIMLLPDRLKELKSRDHDLDRMDELSKAGSTLEKVLQRKVNVNLADINDANIERGMEKLRNFAF